jgi:hypothetical protein
LLVDEVDFDVVLNLADDGLASTGACLAGMEGELAIAADSLMVAGEGITTEGEAFVVAGEGFDGFVDTCDDFVVVDKGLINSFKDFVDAGAGDGFVVAVAFALPDEGLAVSGLLDCFDVSSFSDSFVFLAAATRSSKEIAFESPDF